MKIEFVQKIDLDGTWYLTTVDDRPVTGSFKANKNEAHAIFLKVVELKGKPEAKTVIESKEI